MTFVNPNNLPVAIEWAEAALRRAKEDEVEAILEREKAEEKLKRLRRSFTEPKFQGQQMDEVKAILIEILNMDKLDTVNLANAAARLVLAERERCARIAETEPELEGPMPPENVEAAKLISMEDHLRITVRLTKSNIAGRIRGT